MKKIVSTIAALGLIAGVASTASALDLTVTGYYKLEGKLLSDGAISAFANTGGNQATTFGNIANTIGGLWSTAGAAAAPPLTTTAAGGVALTTNNSDGANAWWQHDFRIYPTLTVNDHIKVMADIRLVSTSNADATLTAAASNSGMWGNGATTNSITANKIYMDYASPIGKIRMGTTPAGAWGSPYLNSAGAGHRLMWWPNFLGDSPFSLLFFTQKVVENDGGVAGNGIMVDQDTDVYFANVGYKADVGQFDMAYSHTRFGATDLDGQALLFNASATVGAINLLGELQHAFGDAAVNVKKDAWAGMGLVTGQVADNITVGGTYFFATGQDTSADNTQFLGAKGTGFNWQPLYIMTGPDMGVLNGDSVAANPLIQVAGVQAVGVFADVAVSPQLTLHAAIGTGWADDVSTLNAFTGTSWSDEYGWEYNLGASYKLLDNLTYDLHLGYWSVGDFVKAGGAMGAAVTPNDVTLVTNSLTMKF